MYQHGYYKTRSSLEGFLHHVHGDLNIPPPPPVPGNPIGQGPPTSPTKHRDSAGDFPDLSYSDKDTPAPAPGDANSTLGHVLLTGKFMVR